jgi:hypothetical protein
MRQLISGVFAAAAVMTVSAAPASACGGLSLFSSCSPCGQAYVSPCAQSYAPAFTYATGCGGCGGWAHERLPELSPQYYHVNQGPTYTGPGNFAPYPTYQENAPYGWRRQSGYGYGYGYGDAAVSYAQRPYYRPWRARVGYGYGVRPSVRYGYGVGHGYGVRHGMGYGVRHGMGYGVRHGMGDGVARGYGVGRGYGHGGMRRY